MPSTKKAYCLYEDLPHPRMRAVFVIENTHGMICYERFADPWRRWVPCHMAMEVVDEKEGTFPVGSRHVEIHTVGRCRAVWNVLSTLLSWSQDRWIFWHPDMVNAVTGESSHHRYADDPFSIDGHADLCEERFVPTGSDGEPQSK